MHCEKTTGLETKMKTVSVIAEQKCWNKDFSSVADVTESSSNWKFLEYLHVSLLFEMNIAFLRILTFVILIVLACCPDFRRQSPLNMVLLVAFVSISVVVRWSGFPRVWKFICIFWIFNSWNSRKRSWILSVAEKNHENWPFVKKKNVKNLSSFVNDFGLCQDKSKYHEGYPLNSHIFFTNSDNEGRSMFFWMFSS